MSGRKLNLVNASLSGLKMVALFSTLVVSSNAYANAELVKMQANPNNWVMPTGDYANQRYSKLDQINITNAKNLQPMWSFSTGVLRGHEGAPLVIDGVMYLHTPFPNIVYALSLEENGKILWKYTPKQDTSVIGVMCCDTVNRGLAYGDGKILLSQADTTLLALDAKTGKEVWSVKNGDPKIGETSTAAPMVVKDNVLVGISGGEFGIRGHLTAYNLKTGKRVWRAHGQGPDSDILFDSKTTELGKPVGENTGTSTFEGDQWQKGGSATWGYIAYCPELNLIYYGTGNPGTWNASQRPGDNKWSMTIMARDADTGVAKWVYQMTPHDEWDYDGTNEMVLTELKIGGKNVKALTHFDRNGFGYTLNRENGMLLVAEKYDPTVNWASHIDMKTGRPVRDAKYSTDKEGVKVKGICPAALGTKDQQPSAFSPRTGLNYIPTNHLCMDYEPSAATYTAGQPYVGASTAMYAAAGGTHTGNFIAWDATTGKIKWSVQEQFAVWSGALATAGDVVFYGTLEGYLKAVDAKTGKALWQYKTPSGIIGNVMTYSFKGKQYVAVLSGIGGWAGIGMAAGIEDGADAEGFGAVGAFRGLTKHTTLGGSVTVFALPGK